MTKPLYHVPSMSEIEALPHNGYSVVSTFSGCGGSCLGFRMAGYKVLWASEFIPAAAEVYQLNNPTTILDTVDIRGVDPAEILDAIGLEVGQVDVLEGSPPCASFSMSGNREKHWGEVVKYSETKQRVDDLFFEYARIVRGIQPKVFVAENVSGLVKGKAKGYFKLILRELADCGYKVRAQLLDASWLGVPQARQRVIFMGVREDLGLRPKFPKPLPYQYTVRDALSHIQFHGRNPAHREWEAAGKDITKFMLDSSKYPAPTILQSGADKAAGYVIDAWPEKESGTGRIVRELKPGEGGQKVRDGSYFNIQKAHWNRPSGTVLASSGYGRNIAAGIFHPDEPRRFYIDELKRIMSFPDDFQLTGTYGQQWERLGRAVPPVMMSKIAEIIRDEILNVCAA